MSENKNIINEQEPQDDHMIEGRNAVLEAFVPEKQSTSCIFRMVCAMA